MPGLTPENAIPLVRALLDKGVLSASDLDKLTEGPDGRGWQGYCDLVDGDVVSGPALAAALAELAGTTWLDLEAGLEPTVWEVRRDGSRKLLGGLDELLAGMSTGLPHLPGAHFLARGAFPVGRSGGVEHLLCMDPEDTTLVKQLAAATNKKWAAHPGTVALFRELERRLAELPEAHGAATESLAAATGMAEVASDLAEAAVKLADTALGGIGAGELPGQAPLLAANKPASASGLIDGSGGDFDPDVDVDLGRPLPPGPEAQVLRIVNGLLGDAVHQGASDLHLEPYEKDVRIRYRVDGKLTPVKTPPAHLFGQIVSRLKILSKMDIAEKRVPQDGGITMRDGDSRVDLRVSTVPTCYGEKMVLRVLANDGIPDNMEVLGLSEQQARDFIGAANAHHGLIFVTGPTGSGKSTTLYCALNLTNTADKNIVTVEDPVEYKIFGLNQVPIRASAGMTFAGALRAFLRQDPDVIMVGEVRDTETAQICMRAALTGHLVLSTLHTNSALQVVTRLTDMGVEPFLLGPALRLVEAQRLVRRLCTECKQSYELPKDVAQRHGLEPGENIYRPGAEPGCPKCSGSGYKGRVGIYEVIAVDDNLQEKIARGASEKQLSEIVRERGVDLIPDSARKKLREGITSLEEVSDYIRDILAQ